MDSERQHSGLGIVSFGIFAAGTPIVAVLMTGMGQGGGWGRRGGMGGTSAGAVILGGAILGLVLGVTALTLGIAGLRQRGRIKVFAILGVVFSALALILLGFYTAAVLILW